MSVDEKYVEEVNEVEEVSDFDSVLEEFGIEASNKGNGNGIDFDGYTTTYLRDMYNGDICVGRPEITDVYTVEFKDKNSGETQINHKIDLILWDDTYEDEKEAFIFPINLNSDNLEEDLNRVVDVNSQSGLYALAMGFMELEAKGISKAYDHLDVVPYAALQKKAKQYKNITVEIVEKQFGSSNYYNSFRITEGEQ